MSGSRNLRPVNDMERTRRQLETVREQLIERRTRREDALASRENLLAWFAEEGFDLDTDLGTQLAEMRELIEGQAQELLEEVRDVS